MSNQADTLVINGNNYHPNEHTSYGKPKINKRGGKNIPVNNSSSRKKLYLSTPLMMTWGANQKDYDDYSNYYDSFMELDTIFSEIIYELSVLQEELRVLGIKYSEEMQKL